MQKCPRCLKRLKDSAFSPSNLTKKKCCRKCQAKWFRGHYERNKKYHIDRNRVWKNKLLVYIRKKKDKPCSDCKQSFHYSAMDFDHLDKKNFNLGTAHLSKSYKAIDAEIAKCDIVCSNCHRFRTWTRMARIVP